MRVFACSTFAVCLLTSAFATPGEGATIRVDAGGNLQSALNAAQPGDVILLQAGATFTGNFVLPVKSGAAFITVRSAASDSDLPGTGVRMSPAWASYLPKLRSGNDAAPLRTAAGAHHWRLLFLEFLANKEGYGDLLQIGDGSGAQNNLAKVPTDIEVDRVYIHGDPIVGQKRGIAINGARVTILSSYISDCKAAGMDSQAIAGWNGPGPYTIENNYLEGAAENVLLGGSDPAISGLVTSDVTFRRNYVAKPVSWRNTIIDTPAGLTVAAETGGSLPGGSVSYIVVARRAVGQGKTGRSTGASISASVPAGGLVRLNWSPVSGASDYQVFARGYVWTVSTTTFTDTGAAGAAAAAPTGEGTKWVVKNIFELKNARRVTMQYNLFETNWQSGQAGYAIVFTPRNSDGTCTWCTIEDVDFSYNIVRHAAAAINILGHDTAHVSGVTTNIRIRHNLFYDINQIAWGGNGWFVQIGDGPRYVIIDHNTVDHDGTSVVYVYGGTSTSREVSPGFQFTNNLARHGTYGISGAFDAYGSAILNGFFPGSVFAGNLLTGGTASRYPTGNYFSGDFSAQFVSPTAGDYGLTSSSVANGRATDGSNIGADVATISSQTAFVGNGQTVPNTAPARPQGLRLVTR